MQDRSINQLHNRRCPPVPGVTGTEDHTCPDQGPRHVPWPANQTCNPSAMKQRSNQLSHGSKWCFIPRYNQTHIRKTAQVRQSSNQISFLKFLINFWPKILVSFIKFSRDRNSYVWFIVFCILKYETLPVKRHYKSQTCCWHHLWLRLADSQKL